MKIYHCWGDLTGISAKKDVLLCVTVDFLRFLKMRMSPACDPYATRHKPPTSRTSASVLAKTLARAPRDYVFLS